MSRENPIKVILADDHKIVREAIQILLEDDLEIQIVGVASNGQELMTLLSDTKADLVLMDVLMPLMDGYEATIHIREKYPETRVLALSMLEKEQFVRKMFDAGATGFMLKNAGRNELRSAIKLVACGNQYISADLFSKFLAPIEETVHTSTSTVLLSKRELEVLSLIAEGLTNTEIAIKLFTSKRTIEKHRQSIIKKTDSRNTANLIKFAIKQGYISIN